MIEARLFWDDDLLLVRHHDGERATLAALDLPPLPGLDEDLVVEAPSTLRLDRFTLHVVRTTRERTTLPRFAIDLDAAYALLGALAIHALLLALVFHARGAPFDDAGRRATIEGYLASIDARVEPRAAPEGAPPPKDGERAAGDEGAAGNPARANDGARAKETRGSAYHAKRANDGEAIDPTVFGMLAIVANDHAGDRAGSSPWAKDLGPAAMGSLFGATVDDAMGFGGLGLSGGGEGGGGKGTGIGIAGVEAGAMGTCGAGCRGALRGGHQVKSPILRCGAPENGGGCATQVTGRLPPEVVQRVVRGNFGRFRACYEQGLQRNPSLEGRIAVKFVIGRDGAVALVSTAESSVEDRSVSQCVARAFAGLTFPEPEGGIVTVVYPLVLSTSS